MPACVDVIGRSRCRRRFAQARSRPKNWPVLRPRGPGERLDHLLVSPTLKGHVAVHYSYCEATGRYVDRLTRVCMGD